ncbi:MAG: pyridoxal-phosphate dependent enzyme [Myxococcales bacterium]|nr:pyridoxal-phosphate dependent enzyme [Myxococcales bacterium]
MMHGALEDITKAVGNTPIVRLNRVAQDVASEVYVKCEFLNPGGSHKDRLAWNLLRRAEENGLRPGGTIVEATSGNTGASLALLAAIKGYKCVFVMPDKMSQEKISGLRAFGAKVVVCPTAVDADDPRSYYKTARRIADETPNCFYANQYHNPANPEAHYLWTGPEIWKQTQGDFDAFVAGMGTGGTVSGCGKYFKEQSKKVQIVGVDPVGSLYYDFVKTGRITKPFSYKVEGIGEDFFPTSMNLDILDDVVRVDDKECFLMTRALTREEGLFVGGSGGAAVAGAIKWARAQKKPKKILVFLCDAGQKYVSKIFNDDWMRENGFLDDEPGLGTVADLLASRPRQNIVTASPRSTVRDVIRSLKELGISQLPVVERGKLRGIVGEVDLLRHLVNGQKTLDSSVGEILEGDYATVTPDTKIELLQNSLADAKVAIVTNGTDVVGIVTKIDLIDFLARRQREEAAPPSVLPPAPSAIVDLALPKPAKPAAEPKAKAAKAAPAQETAKPAPAKAPAPAKPAAKAPPAHAKPAKAAPAKPAAKAAPAPAKPAVKAPPAPAKPAAKAPPAPAKPAKAAPAKPAAKAPPARAPKATIPPPAPKAAKAPKTAPAKGRAGAKPAPAKPAPSKGKPTKRR